MNKKLFDVSVIVFLLLIPAFGFGQQGKSEQEKKIDELIDNLGTRYWEKAADELVKIGEAAVEPLIKLLNIGSGRPSENANLVLARIGTKKALDEVVEALKNPEFDHRVRAFAAMALGDTKSKDFIVPLIEALKTDGHWWVRNFVVGSLGKIGSERAVKPLLNLLKHEPSYVREGAAWVLGEMKSKVAVHPLIQLLKDRDMGWMAAVSLGKIKDERAIDSLKKILAEQDTRAGKAAAWALARILTAEIENSY